MQKQPSSCKFRVISSGKSGYKAIIERVSLFNQAAVIIKDPYSKNRPIRVTTSIEFERVSDYFLKLGVHEIDTDTFDQRALAFGIDYFDYMNGCKSPKKLSITRGLLTVIMDSFESSANIVNDAITLLFDMENNQDPHRQVVRYRDSINSFVSQSIGELKYVFGEDEPKIKDMLCHMFHQILTDVYWMLKSKAIKICQLFSKKLARALTSFVGRPPAMATKGILKRICGHYLPSYCQ